MGAFGLFLIYILFLLPLKFSFFYLSFYRFFFIFLSFWLIYILIKCSNYIFKELYIILYIIFIVCFLTNNVFIFFIFFELSLIPTYFLVIKGNTPERSLASNYLVLYTFLGRFPLFLNIILFGFIKRFFFKRFFLYINEGFFFFFLLAFLFKLPIFFFHLWLPKAHVEASTEGRMVLAGILLKLGSYGILLFLPYLYLKVNLGIFVSLGGIIAGLIGLLQIDIKRFIAYSSIIHMSFMVLASCGVIFISSIGVIYMGVGHGFVSAGIFYILSLVYKLSGSRKFYFLNGILKKFSYLLFFSSICLILKSSVPIRIGFLGEFFMFVGGSIVLGEWSFFLIFFINFIGGLLSIFLFMIFFHGSSGFLSFIFSLKKIRVIFFLNLFSFWFFPLFLLFYKWT